MNWLPWRRRTVNKDQYLLANTHTHTHTHTPTQTNTGKPVKISAYKRLRLVEIRSNILASIVVWRYGNNTRRSRITITTQSKSDEITTILMI